MNRGDPPENVPFIKRAIFARLTLDLPGSALVGRDSHPLDDVSEFRQGIGYLNAGGRPLWHRTHQRLGGLGTDTGDSIATAVAAEALIAGDAFHTIREQRHTHRGLPVTP